MEKKKNRQILLMAIVAVISISISMIYIENGEDEGREYSGERNDLEKEKTELDIKTHKIRGSRPKNSRLKDGVAQIENQEEAILLAKKSLKRLDSELAQASDTKTRETIARKRALIEKAITRLASNN